MHLLSCGWNETKRQNLRNRNFVIEKIWWPKMARKVRDQKQHSAPEEGSGNAKKAKEQNLKIRQGTEEVMYLEHKNHNNSILKFIKDIAS